MITMNMRRFENVLYLFAGIAVGMLLATTFYEKEIEKVYEIVEIPKIGDMSDCANEKEVRYYQHLIRTK